MKIYRFRMTQSDNEELVRIIDIPGNYTFEALHLAILSSVEFDNEQLASFYISDEEWNKGQEITLMDMGEDASPITMQDSRIDQLIKKKGDRLIYVYDFMLMWKFYLELQDIVEPNSNWEYPMLVEEQGASPDQYGDKSRYPDEISDEDQKIIDQLKSQGLNLGLGGDDNYDEGYEDDEYDGYY